jgi:ATP-dependent DNA ligase
MAELPVKPQDAKKAESVEEAATKCDQPVIEPKLDGWRLIVHIDGDGEPHVFTRPGKVYTSRVPVEILRELKRFPPDTVLDGEIADATDNKNCTAVVNVLGKSKDQPTKQESDKLHFFVFDLLRMNGVDLRSFPLVERRSAVQKLLEVADTSRMALVPQAPAEQAYYDLMVEEGYEGAMVKDNAASYASGKRGYGWYKLKATVEIDVVVMGMALDGQGQHKGKVGRFVVGQYVEGELQERARVNPYDDAMRDLMTFHAVRSTADLPNALIGKVCTIKHYGVLKDGLRHPTFVKWREDKAAKECMFDNG